MGLLQIDNLAKHFGGIIAVDGVDLTIEQGQICGLIGPNGSGKTTILNLITGIYTPTAGKVLFQGEEMQKLAPHEICQKGIGRTFQNIRLLKSQTAFNNVRLGGYFHNKSNLADVLLGTRKAKTQEEDCTKRVIQVLELIGLQSVAEEKVSNLPYGYQKTLEIGRALMTQPKLLLLDEPAAGLNTAETQQLSRLVHKISESGVSILLIEHEMAFVESLCERVFVLNYGKKIAEGTFAQIKANAAVVEAYLGKERKKRDA